MLHEGMAENDNHDGHGLWSPEVSHQARGTRDSDWRTLHARLQSNLRQRTVLEAAAAGLLLEAEETRLYLRLGHPSMTVYMERELACSRHTAAEHLRVAHELVELPMIAAEYRAGELPFTVVREVTRPATADTEGAWLDAIRGKTSGEVQQLVKGRKKGDRPEHRPDPKLIKEKIFVEVSAETYAMWRQARGALDDERGERLSDDELIQTLCERACEPVPTGTGASAVTRPGFQISVTTCKQCKRAFHVGPGVEVEVPADRMEEAACDAVNLGDLESSVVPKLGSEIPAGTRVKVFTRDGFACVVPGCTSRRHLHCHHVVWRSHGGGHEAWNICLLCSSCHRQVHEGTLTIEGRAPNLVFGRRDALVT